MNGVMSLSTRPASFHPTRELLLLHAAALAYCKKAFPFVELVTDEPGIILADRMRWDYDTFTLHLEHADPALANIWSHGKLIAQLNQNAPFAHVDNDILLFQPLPEEITTAQVFAQSKDEPRLYLEEFAQEAMLIAGIDVGTCCFNTGLIGGTHVAALHAYAQKALDAMKLVVNGHDPHLMAIVIEQAMFGQFFRQQRMRVAEVIPFPLSAVPDDFAGREFTHLWGSSKRHRPTLEKVERRFRDDHPDAYERFLLNFEHLPHALARTTLGARSSYGTEEPAPTSSGYYYGPGCYGYYTSGYNDLAAIGCHTIERQECPDMTLPAACGKTVAVVTSHNYAHYLAECLTSLCGQTLPFDAIVVVDDASTDNSYDLADSFDVIRARVDVWDFTTARNMGLEIALAACPDARFVLFVDADNYLALNFHERLKAQMVNPEVGVAYANIAYVAEDGRHLSDRCESYDYDKLRHHNFADACSLVRREALEQAGGLQRLLGGCGLTDWALWLRVTRCGWKMTPVADTSLFYRRHNEAMHLKRIKDGKHVEGLVDLVQSAQVVTIITLFSGRWFALDPFFSALRALKWPKDGLRIVAVDNSGDDSFHALLGNCLELLGIEYVLIRDNARINEGKSAAEFADDATARRAQGYDLSAHLARLYSRARQSMPTSTDYVLCLEDDILLPVDGLANLFRGMVTNPSAGVVCGVVANRFIKQTKCLIAWVCKRDGRGEIIDHRHLTAPPSPGINQKIDGSGFMATLFRGALFRKLALRPSPGWSEDERPYYDFAAAQEVRRLGWFWLLAGAVRCKHLQRDGSMEEFPLPLR